MSNNKQSSVEYLMDKLFDPSSMVKEQLEWFEQAKAMHENESFETFKAGQDSMEKGGKGFDQYYNEKFGGNK